MSDVVERLRAEWPDMKDAVDAANEILRLRAEIEKLRKYNEILQNKHFRLQHKLKLLRQMLDEPPH